MDEMILLEECPICRGAGMITHEGGWQQKENNHMDEMILLEECPICRGAGMITHEGGWSVQVECADCSAHTVYDSVGGVPHLPWGRHDYPRGRLERSGGMRRLQRPHGVPGVQQRPGEERGRAGSGPPVEHRQGGQQRAWRMIWRRWCAREWPSCPRPLLVLLGTC